MAFGKRASKVTKCEQKEEKPKIDRLSKFKNKLDVKRKQIAREDQLLFKFDIEDVDRLKLYVKNTIVFHIRIPDFLLLVYTKVFAEKLGINMNEQEIKKVIQEVKKEIH